MLNQSLILSIASSYAFQKLPVELVAQILNLKSVLEAMNEYTVDRYSELFWNGEYNKEAFSPRFRLVCPPTSVDFDFSVGFPFAYKTIFLEVAPFTPGCNFAKFGIHKKLKKPLLCDDARFL
jgi:hypothetical protein